MRRRDGTRGARLAFSADASLAATAALVLAGRYAYADGDCTRQCFHLDDFWIVRDASRISVHSLRDVVQILAAGRNGFLLDRPLSQVAYSWGLHQVLGADVAGYHAMQLAAHVVNALLVYAIAARLFGAGDTGAAAATAGVWWLPLQAPVAGPAVVVAYRGVLWALGGVRRADAMLLRRLFEEEGQGGAAH